MNRLYNIKVGSMEMKGLIAPSELPEVVTEFYRMSAKKGANADYLGNGLFHAVKNDVTLVLTIGAYHNAIPSRRILDNLEDAMDLAF